MKKAARKPRRTRRTNHEHRGELAPPPATETDPQSFELLRVWAAHRQQHVSIHPDLNGGAEGFGYMLAQLARHGAILYGQLERIPRAEALKRLRRAFDAEWKAGTWPTGRLSS